MSVLYPQVGCSIRVLWEDFGSKTLPQLQQAYTIEAIPKSGKVSLNAYSQADTFEVEFDYNCFPFDPRCIKSAFLSVHVENMKSLVNGVRPVQITLKAPATYGDKHNTLLVGYADEESIMLNDSARTVTFKGRDYTSIFIDAKWPGKLIEKSSGLLDVILQKIIKQLPAAGDITLDNRTGIATLPNITKLSADLKKLANKGNTRAKETYWDVIQRVIGEAALIGFIEIDKLVLTNPRTLYNPDKAVQFIYGKNIQSLELNRKIGRTKNVNVVVQGITDTKEKKVDRVRIPKDAKTLPERGSDIFLDKVAPQGGVTPAPQLAPDLVFSVTGVKSHDWLIDKGEQIYLEHGRQQLEGSLTTYDLESVTGLDARSFSCFDLTKLRVGTPLLIVVDPDDLQFISQTSNIPRRTAYLVKKGYSTSVATSIATCLDKLSSTFYTKEVNFSFDAEGGFKIDVQFLNLIETAGQGL